MKKRIGMLFDCLRAPYDVAHIIQIAVALDICDLYITGSSIDPNNKKVITKVKSWGIEKIPEFIYFQSLEEAVVELHKKNKYLIGTHVSASKSLYSCDFTENDCVIVFGTESSGLILKKVRMLDDLIKIPMSQDCKFLTLPSAVPIIAYEFYRQIIGG